MSDKKPSLISKVRNGEKLSFFEKFFPLFLPLHIIGHSLKAKDSYSAYKKQLVTDIGSGKPLSLFNEFFSVLHPITYTKGLFLRAKNHHKEFLNSVEQNILKGEPRLSIFEQFREIFDVTCWPTVYRAYKQKLLPFTKKEPPNNKAASNSHSPKNRSFIPQISLPKLQLPSLSPNRDSKSRGDR